MESELVKHINSHLCIGHGYVLSVFTILFLSLFISFVYLDSTSKFNESIGPRIRREMEYWEQKLNGLIKWWQNL